MRNKDTDWFNKAGWGLFAHYLHPVVDEKSLDAPKTTDAWNRQIDNFNTTLLADQLQEIGAGYFFLTIGQNSGFFLSPNKTYDDIVGRSPSLCSKRDLVMDLSRDLSSRDIKLMVYLPANAPSRDLKAVEALECVPTQKNNVWKRNAHRVREEDDRMINFQRKWEAVIREWSTRWGNRIHGWWIDGCYDADYMYRPEDEPNFKSFSAALKAGNRHSIVAFASGHTMPPIEKHSEYDDYTAGELNAGLPVPFSQRPLERWVDDAQYHILTFLGEYWCHDKPRFNHEFVKSYTELINSFGGVITWDVPLDANGGIKDNYYCLLKEAFLR